MKTITLENELNFTDALQSLLDGKCIGIRPKGNANYIIKFQPNWMEKSKDYCIGWHRSFKDGKCNQEIRVEQYLDVWFLVVIDCNSLPDNFKNYFILENVTGLIS